MKREYTILAVYHSTEYSFTMGPVGYLVALILLYFLWNRCTGKCTTHWKTAWPLRRVASMRRRCTRPTLSRRKALNYRELKCTVHTPMDKQCSGGRSNWGEKVITQVFWLGRYCLLYVKMVMKFIEKIWNYRQLKCTVPRPRGLCNQEQQLSGENSYL